MNWKTSESHPLRIAEVDLSEYQKLGLSFCPGKTQPNAMSGPWKRDLETDLFRIRSKGYEGGGSLMRDPNSLNLKFEMRKGRLRMQKAWIWFHLDGDVPTKPIMTASMRWSITISANLFLFTAKVVWVALGRSLLVYLHISGGLHKRPFQKYGEFVIRHLRIKVRRIGSAPMQRCFW